MAFEVKDFIYRKHGTGSDIAYFQASDMDEASNPSYYGFLADDGRWIIMEKTDNVGATGITTVRYCFGQSDYTTAWTGRAGLTYSYYNAI